MKVYVAAKFEEAHRAREAQALLRASGHTITHDWTAEDEGGREGQALQDYLAGCADADLTGAVEAEAILLLHHDALCGGLVELGAALADPTKLLAVVGGLAGKRQPIFYRLPRVRHFNTVEQGVRYVNAVERMT